MSIKKKPFTVGFYADNSKLASGGIFPYSVRISRALKNYNFDEKLELRIVNSESEIRSGLDGALGKIARRIKETIKVALRNRPLLIAATEIELQARGTPKIDLLHVPIQTPPFFGIPYICTMHDVQELYFPKFFSATERAMRAVYHRMAIQQATRVVVSFDHVKHDLINHFDCKEEKIAVIPIPFDEVKLKSPSPNKSLELEEKHKSLEKFFLYPAQTWEHKNHIRLIAAFEHLSKRSRENISLVCTGHKNDYFSTIAKRVSESPVREKIHFLGLVEEDELNWLYGKTAGVVVPSLYEAGSFPVIEAMALSIPVICARTTSLPDTIGCDELLFDPLDISDMAAKMELLLNDTLFVRRCVSQNTQKFAQLCQNKTAEHLESLWLSVMHELR